MEVINVEDFIYTLQKKDLVIVPKNEWEKIALKKELMRKHSLTIGEIVKSGLLGVSTRQSVKYKIEKGVIRPEEVVPRSPLRITTECIKRLIGEN